MAAKRSRKPKVRKRIVVTGDDALQKKLDEIPDRTAVKLARTANRTIAKGVAELARSFAPVDTGTLEDSIKVKALPRLKENRSKAGARVVTSDNGSLFRGEAYYGGFQEFGTVNMQPNSFMLPALDLSRGTVLAQFGQAMREAIAKEQVKQAKKKLAAGK